ncbi:hypothetical protein P171DRAFT_440469 [Karstenula rhodostoma CBS 690.94]|uniref:Uncharacterized protein n=1 Tax=Karstenula rhodostoma CBS 690.94 TaxID=1392251 RepID=A0A9P4PTD0_9PLEO|nr:hypothetical protein P171DRAFT_440469 [Karstenula rhodostoma CBS 690.94]
MGGPAAAASPSAVGARVTAQTPAERRLQHDANKCPRAAGASGGWLDGAGVRTHTRTHRHTHTQAHVEGVSAVRDDSKAASNSARLARARRRRLRPRQVKSGAVQGAGWRVEGGAFRPSSQLWKAQGTPPSTSRSTTHTVQQCPCLCSAAVSSRRPRHARRSRSRSRSGAVVGFICPRRPAPASSARSLEDAMDRRGPWLQNKTNARHRKQPPAQPNTAALCAASSPSPADAIQPTPIGASPSASACRVPCADAVAASADAHLPTRMPIAAGLPAPAIAEHYLVSWPSPAPDDSSCFLLPASFLCASSSNQQLLADGVGDRSA